MKLLRKLREEAVRTQWTRTSPETESSKTESPVKHSEKKTSAGGLFKAFKLPRALKRNKMGNTNISASDGSNTSIVITPPTQEVLTFEQNLQINRLDVAGQQLIDKEEYLYGPVSEEVVQLTTEREKEKEQLTSNRQALLSYIDLAVKSSVSLDQGRLEALTSAVKAILQEEEQDRRWLNQEGQQPDWRPSKCRSHHYTVLESLVEERMDNAELPPAESNKLRSSLQRDVCGKGRRLQEDLLRVVKDVKGCYPEEMDICNLYGQMYHQAFSRAMRKITEYGLGMADCSYVLYWVNVAYPEILHNPELKNEINSEKLGKLLSLELTTPLEEQYLSHQETEVQTLLNKMLKSVEQSWREGSESELRDNCYFSPLAIDVIQCINAAVKSIETILEDTSKVQLIVGLLKEFLNSYKQFQEKVIKAVHQKNSRTVIMANLACVEQFRDYIVKKADIFPLHVKECCLSIVAELKNCGYTFLTSPIHKDLKSQYRALGTPVWLEKKNMVETLFEGITKHAEDLKGLTDTCHQELLSQLHLEVTVEYVRRLLKRKIKLRDKEMQEQAARSLCEDGQRLHKLFTEAGSRQEWLSEVLAKIAEVLKLQDISALQLEIATLSQTYRDLSEIHVSALLSLKSNLSSSAVKRVRKTFVGNQDTISSGDTPPFFSMVQVK